MRFGKIENNHTSKFINFVFAFLTFFNCATFISCQSKEQKVESALKQCQQLLDKDDLASAVKCYAEATLSYPENSDKISKTGDDAFFGKCVEYKNKKDVNNALKCFYAAIGLLPDKANAHFQLADAYYQYAEQESKTNGFYDTEILDRAEAAVKKGFEINPEDAPAHALYGDIFDGKSERKKALREYRQAVKLAPKEGTYWIKLAMLQEKLDDNDIAVWSFQQALKINPDDDVALYFLGDLYEKMGKIDEAIETIEKRIKLEPASEETLQKLKNLKRRREPEQQKPEKSNGKAVGGTANNPFRSQ